jgi:hypothetical protein
LASATVASYYLQLPDISIGHVLLVSMKLLVIGDQAKSLALASELHLLDTKCSVSYARQESQNVMKIFI